MIINDKKKRKINNLIFGMRSNKQQWFSIHIVE